MSNWLRSSWPLIALGIGAVVISIWARHTIYPAYSWNRDEPVYLWQIDALRHGRFTTTDGGAPMFFRPWLTAAQDGVLFSQYTLGWPLVLLGADLILGTPDGALAVGTLLTVLGTYALARELTQDRAIALVSAGVMMASPILAIQGGVYLGYLFTLGLGLLFATAVLSGVRLRRSPRIFVAGVLLGWIFLTRPFDALLWGAAVAAYLAIVHWGELRRLLPATAWLALGFGPLFVATLSYNRHVTGSFTQFPITAADAMDTYWFGRRQIMPGFRVTNYTVFEALKSTVKNGLYLPLFLAGTYLGAIVAAVGLWLRRRERSTLALVAIGAVFPLGYFFFWGMRVSAGTARISGPIYFVPLYAPLSILIATVLVSAWKRRRRAGIALVAVLVAATVPLEVNRLAVNRDISEAQLPWKDSTASIREPALVFVADSGLYLLFLNPFSSNDPDLDGQVVFATDRGPENLDLIAAMPGRTPFRQQASVRGDELGPRENPITPEISLTKLTVLRADALSLRVRVANPGDEPFVTVFVESGDDIVWRTLATNSTKGALHEADFTVVVADAEGERSDSSTVKLRDPLGTVTIGVGFGSSDGDARRPIARESFPYRVDGANLEVLLPTGASRRTRLGSIITWRPAFDLPELDVEVTAGDDVGPEA